MKVLISFSCWARLPGDQLEHFDVAAADRTAAIAAGFARYPRAAGVTCHVIGGVAEERRHG